MHRKQLYFVLGLFIAPIVAAQLVLTNGWYQGAATNNGELLTSPLQLTNSPQAWLLLYNPPANCAQVCKQSLWQIKQVHTLLSAEGERLQRQVVKDVAMLGEQAYANAAPTIRQQYPAMRLLAADQIATESLVSDSLYLVDPQGNIFMRYQFTGQQQTASQVSAGLLSDLKRLLKVSKIG